MGNVGGVIIKIDLKPLKYVLNYFLADWFSCILYFYLKQEINEYDEMTQSLTSPYFTP